MAVLRTPSFLAMLREFLHIFSLKEDALEIN